MRTYNTDFTNADLRGANLKYYKGGPTIRNTIWNNGVIIWANFGMGDPNDSFSIRKNESMSAKTENGGTYCVTNSTLTLEAGAKLEVVHNSKLAFGSNSTLAFEITNADSDTNINIVQYGSSYDSFVLDGGKILVNLIGDFTEEQYFSILT